VEVDLVLDALMVLELELADLVLDVMVLELELEHSYLKVHEICIRDIISRFVLEIHVSSVAHTTCGLQKKHGSPIQISIISSKDRLYLEEEVVVVELKNL
jgi:hypothetical protein